MFMNHRPPYSPKRNMNNYKMRVIKYYYDPNLNRNFIYFDPYFSTFICIIFTASFAKIASNMLF